MPAPSLTSPWAQPSTGSHRDCVTPGETEHRTSKQSVASFLLRKHALVLGFALMPTLEKAPPEVRDLLSKPIRDLGLKLEGSAVERYVHQLYRELDAKGL